MAAHLEGRGVSTLDVTGLAQKNGPVSSHVRVADDPGALHATRVGAGSADLLLACDPVVATHPEVLGTAGKGRTRALLDTHVAPTFAFAHAPDLDLDGEAMRDALRAATADELHALAARELATALLGDAVFAHALLLGFALQRGWLPVGRAALARAIELNGRAVEKNLRALAWGRRAAVDLEAVERAAAPRRRTAPTPASSLEDVVAHRVELLTAYQGRRLARRYRARVEQVAAREREVVPQAGASPLATAVARSYAKLLAYKDEYEVARLWSDGEFQRQLARELAGEPRIEIQLAPQLLNRRDRQSGRAQSRRFGPWILPALRGLAKLRFLRGTPLDPFGRTAHRRLERALIGEYEARLDELLAALTPENHGVAVEIAALPEQIRGFDTVKEASLARVREREPELLAAFRGASD